MRLNEYVTILRNKFNNGIFFPFQEILNETMIQQILQEENIKYRQRLYTPLITLWIWLRQVLDKDKSCKNAVSGVMSQLVSAGTPADQIPSTDTGAYCKARKRLKESFLLRLVRWTGQRLHQMSDQLGLHWCGRRVFVVDGSTITGADTPDNQKEYPQSKSQKEGCGFPLANIVALFCLKTGAVLETFMGSHSDQELNLFRSLYKHLKSGDVALGDRLYGSYADICLLKARGIDAVFRMHGRRKVDFRKGKRLGILDHIVQWNKPRSCPSGLDPALFAQLPERIMLREVRFLVERKGFPTKWVTLVTTLLDDSIYPKEALAELYHQRWQAEIDLRHLKTTMVMEHLLSKTPHMVRNEYYVHLLAYNLIRTLMFQAGTQHGVECLSLSFQATIQHFGNFSSCLANASNDDERGHIYSILLYLVSKEQIPVRPGRSEPRLKKRRPKSYGWLKQPRQHLRQKLVA
jgi:hypothetical protein